MALAASLLGCPGRRRHARGRAGREDGRHQGLRRRGRPLRPLRRKIARRSAGGSRTSGAHAGPPVRGPAGHRRTGDGRARAAPGPCPISTCLIAPVGGGGLIAGSATAVKALRPGIRVVGVEPEAGDDTRRSLEAGTRVRLPEVPRTIADGLQVDIPGELTFALNRRLVDQVVTVTDPQIVQAMAFLFERLKVVVEPSGAVGVAALLAGRIEAQGAEHRGDPVRGQRRRGPVRRAGGRARNARHPGGRPGSSSRPPRAVPSPTSWRRDCGSSSWGSTPACTRAQSATTQPRLPETGAGRRLHASGFTDRVVSPFDERDLLDLGLGITNLVERATRPRRASSRPRS